MHLNISSIPIATVSIAILNILIFVEGVLSASQVQIIRTYGFIPIIYLFI